MKGGIQLADGSGVVAAGGSRADVDGRSVSFSDGGGPVLDAVRVQLIFWGAAWSAAGQGPSADDVTGAVRTILASPYMSGLAQYRGIGPGSLAGVTMATGSEPPQPFTAHDVASLVRYLAEAGTAPEPHSQPQLLYCVMLPPGASFQDPATIGEHSWTVFVDYDFPVELHVERVRYAWVTNDGTLDSLTTVFSHELVEACTDPEGSGFQAASGTCSGAGWCEIGDVCDSTGLVDGVRVQSYWSQRDGTCLVPGSA